MVGTQSIAKEMFYRNEAVSIAIQIASPCRVSWDSMEGDDITRFCGLCHLNVYNLSAINSKAAEEFLQSRVSSERVCVRFFRRHDGTITVSYTHLNYVYRIFNHRSFFSR